MTHHWDQFSKSLAEESLPRRESLRRLGLLFAGAVLSPLGRGTAWARGSDPCKAFCNQCPKSQRSQCLAACRACRDAGRTLSGGCGNYFCCGAGQKACGSYCADLANDPYNCGDCGYVCDDPGYQDVGVACVSGTCEYYICGPYTDYSSDERNCGRCGNVCPWNTACVSGVCDGGGGDGYGGF